jgi:hypothetical protein
MLVSDDDGIYSPGLAVLAEVAAQFEEVGLQRRMWSSLPWGKRLRPIIPWLTGFSSKG